MKAKLKIHYAAEPLTNNKKQKLVTWCGCDSNSVTNDINKVTCLRCVKQYKEWNCIKENN